jgi:hypothetical protein
MLLKTSSHMLRGTHVNFINWLEEFITSLRENPVFIYLFIVFFFKKKERII